MWRKIGIEEEEDRRKRVGKEGLSSQSVCSCIDVKVTALNVTSRAIIFYPKKTKLVLYLSYERNVG